MFFTIFFFFIIDLWAAAMFEQVFVLSFIVGGWFELNSIQL